MSVPTGHAEGWFFQKPWATGHVLAGIVVVVVEELVVVVEGSVVVVLVVLVVVVGRVVVVEVEVLVDVVLVVVVVVVGVLLRSADSRATMASWAPAKAICAPPAVPGNTVDAVNAAT